MIEFLMPNPNIVIRAPLPHVDISEKDMHAIRSNFAKSGMNVSLRAEENYPVSNTWAEIAIMAGTFIAGAAVNHYAEILFDSLDKFLKKGINDINLGVSKGNKLNYYHIPRQRRADAIATIKKAIEELENVDKK